jgi:hypothetical protein
MAYQLGIDYILSYLITWRNQIEIIEFIVIDAVLLRGRDGYAANT